MEKIIGKRIMERRTALGMSRETLAKKSNVCRATIWKIESGNCKGLLVGTLVSIASALGTPVDFFLT